MNIDSSMLQVCGMNTHTGKLRKRTGLNNRTAHRHRTCATAGRSNAQIAKASEHNHEDQGISRDVRDCWSL